MTPLLSNIFAALAFLVFLGVVYLVKNIFDSERILATHPYFKNKLLRLALTGLAIMPVISILKPEYFLYSWVAFLAFLVFTLLGFGYLYDRHITKLPVAYSGIIGQAVYVGIPTTHYVTVAPGVSDRRIPNRFDPEWMKLKKRYPQLKDVDFRKYYVLLVKYETGGNFQKHEHPSTEKFLVLTGKVEMLDGVVVGPGEEWEIPAMQEHYFKVLEPGTCVIEYSKVA